VPGSTALGMLLAGASLVVMMVMEGSSPLAVVLLPPIVLVLGATFGAAVAGCTPADVRRIGRWFRLAFAPERPARTTSVIALIVELATTARRQGLLPLEDRTRTLDDPFLRRGMQLTIDGVPIEQLRGVLEGQIAAQRTDDRVAARFFRRMGGYAPTVGIIGTVVGLVQVLQRLDQPDTLGPLVATAFVATLWGVLSANFVWLPISSKITRNSELRIAEMTLILEGVAEITAGSSPRAVRARLRAMLPPSEAQRVAA
jgi:chemotaxis protein MotA